MVDSNLQWVHSSCSKPWPNKLLERAHISVSCVSTVSCTPFTSYFRPPSSTRESRAYTWRLLVPTKRALLQHTRNNHKSCTCHSSSSYTGYYLWPPLSTIRKEGSPQSHYQPGWAKSITTCHGLLITKQTRPFLYSEMLGIHNTIPPDIRILTGRLYQ